VKKTGSKVPEVNLPTGLPSDYKSDERILAPIPGVVTQVFVKTSQQVQPGDPLLVIEAMKMKNTLRSGHDLTVAAVHVRAGEAIKAGKLLVEFGEKKL
jgi:biotin carboxyl carrier protein